MPLYDRSSRAISPSMIFLVPSLALTPLSVPAVTSSNWSTYLAFLAFGFAEATLAARVRRCLGWVGGTRATAHAKHVRSRRIAPRGCVPRQAPPGALSAPAA